MLYVFLMVICLLSQFLTGAEPTERGCKIRGIGNISGKNVTIKNVSAASLPSSGFDVQAIGKISGAEQVNFNNISRNGQPMSVEEIKKIVQDNAKISLDGKEIQ